MFKVGTITDTDSADVDVKDPNTGKKIASVTLAGPEHPKRKSLLFAKQRRMRNVLQRTGKIELADPADEEQDNLDLLVSCTLGWKDFADAKGEALACTPENARGVFGAPGNGWLKSLLLSALEERDRFIKSSAES
jgi:hypothetical protein